MRFTTLVLVCVSVLFLGASLARSSNKIASREMLGKRISNFSFKMNGGKSLSLHCLKSKRAVVIVFLSFDCPVSNSYSKPLADIHKQFHPYGVSLLGVTTNEDQTPADVERLAKKFDIPFPVVVDYGLKAADALKANFTPEVFVLDHEFVLRYRGRIDNAFYARLKRNHKVSCHDLHQALGELMSGRPVRNPATQAIGCMIPRDLGKVAKDGPVTYFRDVLPILQRNCQGCHRPGQIGQFSLMNYRQAVNWASDIKHFTASRYMPPWKLAGGLPFHNERKLSKKEIDTLARWSDCGKPAGNAKDAPPPRHFKGGWRLGEPDLILTMPAPFQVGPDGRDLFRCFVLPSGLLQDRFVSAIEVLPGNPRIVHHAQLFVDATGTARKLEIQEKQGKSKLALHHGGAAKLDRGPGYSSDMGAGFISTRRLAAWAQGTIARHLPNGFGHFLPKNSDVVLQIHYHRNGRLETDQTKVGLHFAKKTGTRRYQTGVIAGGDKNGPHPLWFAIPAGAKRHKVIGAVQATANCELHSIMPHMHWLGKEIKIALTRPDHKTITLLEIKDWEYNWQREYSFERPVRVEKGSRLEVVAVYDNSDKNPHNPNNPPKTVTYGQQTDDEMCFVYLAGTSQTKTDYLPLRRMNSRNKPR